MVRFGSGFSIIHHIFSHLLAHTLYITSCPIASHRTTIMSKRLTAILLSALALTQADTEKTSNLRHRPTEAEKNTAAAASATAGYKAVDSSASAALLKTDVESERAKSLNRTSSSLRPSVKDEAATTSHEATTDDEEDDSSNNNNINKSVNRRKFVSYHSSKWEQLWLDNIEEWSEEKTICKALSQQKEYIHDYLNLLCTSRLPVPFNNWCVIDDGLHPLWYNTANRKSLEVTFERPVPVIVPIPPPKPVVPTAKDEHIVSKFVFLDEATGETYTEYVEPLVAHLRFPLFQCAHPNPITPEYKYRYATFRGWMLPPAPVVRGDRAIVFDAATAAWESERGGGSPRFFNDVWQRSGVILDEIYVFDDEGDMGTFYRGVPPDSVQKTHFVNKKLAGRKRDHSAEHPFLPHYMKQHATKNDYVILKMDLNTHGRYDHLAWLASEENLVDEMVWEHQSHSSYILEEARFLKTDLTLPQSYDLFLMLRRHGVRAHPWV